MKTFTKREAQILKAGVNHVQNQMIDLIHQGSKEGKQSFVSELYIEDERDQILQKIDELTIDFDAEDGCKSI